ncbi:MAG: hypothetical protein U0271_44970 [Polyangiaceae bacterium]
MIRMRDDRIVISLRQVAELGLEAHAHAILAHEVGHYVHAPGTLADHVRLTDRVRRTLPSDRANFAGLVSNLYTDLLLNDRLQRSGAADVAAVYVALEERRRDREGDKPVTQLWALYMRIYERLGRCGGRRQGDANDHIDADAEPAARLVRFFRDDCRRARPRSRGSWSLICGTLQSDALPVPPGFDTAGTSIGDRIPDGLLEDDFDPDGVPHPAVDRRLSDDDSDAEEGTEEQRNPGGLGRAKRGDGRPDKRRVLRQPKQWIDMLRAAGIKRDGPELVARYYRQVAMPHVIPFPAERIERAGDPLPEGLDAWEPGSPLEHIDWFETLGRGAVVIPGYTTVERTYGIAEGGEPERRPPDLYVGIDCSGSMGNPAYALQYPIVAGAILTLSALRAGSRVMACLSGEHLSSGKYLETPGFIRDEAKLLGVLTDYLGTGCSFGLARLAQTFANAPPRKRPAHLLVISDSDLFGEIENTHDGWAIVERAVANAGGGASAVLRLAGADSYREPLDKLRKVGVVPYLISREADIVPFARAFSRRTFAR